MILVQPKKHSRWKGFGLGRVSTIIHYDAWKDLSTVDALCEKDNAFPVELRVLVQGVHMGTICKVNASSKICQSGEKLTQPALVNATSYQRV